MTNKIKTLGYVWRSRQNGAVYDMGGVSPTLSCGQHSGVEPKIMVFEEIRYYSCASRGRNPDNPSERSRSNGMYRQRIEVNVRGWSNTITTAQKDYLMIEIYS